MSTSVTSATSLAGLWAQLREDWAANGGDWTQPGFRAIAVHRLGVWRLGLRRRLVRGPVSRVYFWLFRWIRNHYGIELFYTVRLGRRVFIAHQHGVVVHPRVEIGDDCIIRHNVTIGARTHAESARAPRIGNRVEIGCGAVVIGDIVIGDDAMIGANAVVTVSVPAGATVVGNPARIIPRPNTHSQAEQERPIS